MYTGHSQKSMSTHPRWNYKSHTLKALPKVRRQMNHITIRGLEEDREFTLENGVFVSKVLEAPRIGSVWQGLEEL